MAKLAANLHLFHGFTHNGVVGLDFLKSATASASLSGARQAHANFCKTGLSTLNDVARKLLKVYANHQCFADANLILDSLPEPDVISFTSLICASSKFEHFSSTLKLFSRMLLLDLVPDHHILPTVIKACAGLSAPRLGQQVHGFAFTSGLGLHSFVESSLVHMYIKLNSLNDARKVFDAMHLPGLTSWSALAAGYARLGNELDAVKIFGKAEELGVVPNLVSWNGMIAGLNQSGHFRGAVLMFRRMHSCGCLPDGTSISSVLSAVSDMEDCRIGVQIHGYVIKLGLESDNCVRTALMDMYGKVRHTSEMSQVFQEMDEADIGACNALIAGLSRCGLVEEALNAFKQFQRRGINLNVVSWTSVTACCSQHGKDIEALELFRQMQTAGVIPNRITIPCLLPACGNIAALTHGKAAHCFSLRRDFSSDVYIGSALIDMYANCGKLHLARIFFDRMPVQNLVCWNAMMSGYATHGKAKEAIEIFELMQKSGHRPDFVSFTSLLSACSQSGLTEEGERFFRSMYLDYGIRPRVEHYACMVTLLGRAGKLKEAYSMIVEMPYEPNASTWGALLSSCRVHQNMHLAEIAAGKLFELEPTNPGNYILLSNIYAGKSKWEAVDKIRNKLKGMGLKKNPGYSWIEVKKKLYMLLAGDNSHPQMALITEKLNRLSIEMKKSGYLPNTKFVLQDVEEQEKEHILCGHSEKLAVVFGILNTDKGSSIRVIKNLRICGDCHGFIKFVSKFEGREILVRDTNRFHHFKDGSCSCGDFW